MKAQKFDPTGKFLQDIELPNELFSDLISTGAIYDAIKAENASLHTGNHSTKGRAEVSGGGKKPWQQKGSGRARQGSTRAPHWVGGGTVHGPKPRSYSIALSKNIKRKAVVSILGKKAKEAKIKVIQDDEMKSYSTKSISSTLKNMGILEKGKVSWVVSGENTFFKASTRNIPFLKYVNSKRIVCRDILYNNNLILTESALKELVAHYSPYKVKK